MRPRLQSTFAARRHDAADLTAEFLLQRGPPWHELEAEPIIDHGEPAGGERHPLPIDARDALAFGRGLIGEPRLRRELSRGVLQLPPAQGGEQIAGEDDALPLPMREAFLGEMIDTRFHGRRAPRRRTLHR